jgi:hypothetical protein
MNIRANARMIRMRKRRPGLATEAARGFHGQRQPATGGIVMSTTTPDPRGPQASSSTIRTRCIRCGWLWPATGFYPNRPRTCKECHREAVDLSREGGMPEGVRATRPHAKLRFLEGVRCIACGRTFYPKQKSARSCSGACRVALHQLNRPEHQRLDGRRQPGAVHQSDPATDRLGRVRQGRCQLHHRRLACRSRHAVPARLRARRREPLRLHRATMPDAQCPHDR